MGLDLGLERAGFEVVAAVECDRLAVKTMRRNRPDLPVIEKRIEEVTTAEILGAAGLQPGEPFVITAGPCCQSFSTAGHRGSLSDPRGGLFRHFLRVVREAEPRFFVMENVRGILSAAKRHRPLAERGPGFPYLEPDEENGSAVTEILKEMRRLRYFVSFDVVNAADYGSPQSRERVVFLGSRDGEPLQMPAPTHAKEGGHELPQWRTLRAALEGLDQDEPECVSIPPKWRKYLRQIPPGGNWTDLPKRSQRAAIGKAYDSWGGRSGFLRRVDWDRPCPSLTTHPMSKATMLCHPDELRPLSVQEYARVQGFPDNWVFEGFTTNKYVQIGNAVPLNLGQAIGEALRNALRRRKRFPVGVVACPDKSLIHRLSEGPRTTLNPRKMRSDPNLQAARKWMACNGRPPIRRLIGKLLVHLDEFEASTQNTAQDGRRNTTKRRVGRSQTAQGRVAA